MRARDVEDQDADGDQQRAAPGERLPVGVGAHRELEDDDRQIRHRRVEVGAPELVVERGEQQRRGLAGDARDREQHAGQHALHRGAVGDHHDHLPLRRAERGRRLAQRARHQPQHVLGGAHDDRHHDDRQRHRAGPGREMAHRHDHHLVDEQADDDRRRAQQDVVDEAHDFAEPAARARIRRERCRRGCRSACRSAVAITVIIDAAEDRVQQAAAAAGRRRHLREQRRADRADAVRSAASTAPAPATTSPNAGRRRPTGP